MNLGGRDEGGDSLSWRMAPPADPRASLRAALSRLLRRAGVLRQERGGPTKIGRIRRERTVETVIPQARDRRAAAWQAIHGAPPVLFHGQTAELRNGRVPVPVAHVYLDVSGSMAGALPTLGGALARPHRDGQLRLYAFSTVVDEVRPRQLHGGDIRNTLGTDINCVLAHLAEIPANRRPRRAVILTDGWIGTARADLLADLRAARMRFVAGLTPDGSCSDLEALGADIIRLPL